MSLGVDCDLQPPCIVGGPVVRRLARIGANSTILPGVEIGEGALVGSPAQVIKRVDELTCPTGWFQRPYVWPPYNEPGPFDPGKPCDEVVDQLHVPARSRPPEPG